MATMTIKRKIQCSADAVFAASTEVEALAREMPNIKKVSVLERGENRAVSRWEGQVEVAGMTRALVWEEEDIWDPASRTLRFRQTKGDLKVYEGQVRIVACDGGAEVEITINYDLGIPFLTGLLVKVVDKIVHENARLYLQALETVALGIKVN